jgi:hypothetical protein
VARSARSNTPEATPALTVTVIDGRARRSLADDTRDYALRVLLRNEGQPTTVGAIVLRVTYRTRANFLGAVDLKPSLEIDSGGDARLTLPAAIATGATVSGWLFFRTSNVIPRHCRVNDYALMILPEADRRLIVDASLPSLLAADTDGPGPATWGWD